MAGRTLDEIVEAVRSMGGEISRSAVHRYKRGFREILERAERSRMLAQMLVASGRADSEGSAVRAGVEMLHGLILAAIEDVGESGGKFSPTDAMKLAVALQNTARAAKVGAEVEAQRAKMAREVVDVEAAPAGRVEVAFVPPEPAPDKGSTP